MQPHLALVLLLAGARTLPNASPDQPGLIVILTDDIGYGDVSAYTPDAKIPTPHLDRLAVEGLRLREPQIERTRRACLQIHSGPLSEVWHRSIDIQPLTP